MSAGQTVPLSIYEVFRESFINRFSYINTTGPVARPTKNTLDCSPYYYCDDASILIAPDQLQLNGLQSSLPDAQ